MSDSERDNQSYVIDMDQSQGSFSRYVPISDRDGKLSRPGSSSRTPGGRKSRPATGGSVRQVSRPGTANSTIRRNLQAGVTTRRGSLLKDHKERKQHRDFIVTLLDEFIETHQSTSELAEETKPDIARKLLPSTAQHIERFLITLTKALQGFGCPTHTLEFHAMQVSKGLGHPAAFAVFPTYTLVSFTNDMHGDYNTASERNPGSSRTLFIQTAPGLNMYKLQLVDELCRRVASYALETPVVETVCKPADIPSEKRESITEVAPLNIIKSVSNMILNTKDEIVEQIENASRVSLTETEPENFNANRKFMSTMSENGKFIDIEDEDFGAFEEDFDCQPVPEPQTAAEIKQRILNVASNGPALFSLLRTLTVGSDEVKLEEKQELLPVSTQTDKIQAETNEQKQKSKMMAPHAIAFTFIAVEDAIRKLNEIVAQKSLYPVWAQILFTGISSSGVCVLMFGGGWNDYIVSLVLGSGVASVARSVHKPFDKIFEFIAAGLVSTLTRTLIVFGVPLCFRATAISSVISMLQGITLAIAMVELATRNMVSGTCRLFYGLTITTLIGVGLNLGLVLTSYLFKVSLYPPLIHPDPITGEKVNICTPIGQGFYFVLFPITITSLCLGINAHWRQLPAMFVAALLAYLSARYSLNFFGSQISTAFGSFVAGCFANVYGRVARIPAVILDMSAMMVLVPGGMAVHSVTELMGSDPTNGVSLVISVLGIALSVGIGFFLAGMVVVPLENWSDHLKQRYKRFDQGNNLQELQF